ncbi:MAG TPA: protein kinase, partial [Ktedonobacterales bacterium]
LLGRYNEVLLSDFGIAVALQQTRTHQTVQGFSGTPIYAAPEQFKGQVSPASDQYALAVVVYEWLIGERPFQGDDIIAIGMAKIQQPPPPLREKLPALSPALEQVVQTALATDPKERFTNVRAFATAFAQAAQSAASPPYVVSAPAPAPAPTIPVAQPPFPQATIPVAPAAAPTQKISNPLPETIRVAPQAQPENVLARTQAEIIEQPPRRKSKPSGPAPQTPPVPAPPKPPSGCALRLPQGRRRTIALSALAALLILGGLGYFALVGVTLKDTYTITTTSAATNVSRQQVNSRLVSISAGFYTQTVLATGGPARAAQAHGALNFTNSKPTPVSLSKGLILADSPGGPGCTTSVLMVLDTDVTIPASPDGRFSPAVAAPAHVLQYGPVGNIPAYPDTRCFSHYEGSGGSNGTGFIGWIVQNNTPFTGGRDAIVQQSDIDGAANSLKAEYPAPTNPGSEVSAAMRANERLLATPAPTCQPKITSNYAVGAKAGEVEVALSFLCTGYAYDYDGAARVATSLLAARAPALFTLNGKTNTTVTSVTLIDPQHATIRLTLAVQGTWVLRP